MGFSVDGAEVVRGSRIRALAVIDASGTSRLLPMPSRPPQSQGASQPMPQRPSPPQGWSGRPWSNEAGPKGGRLPDESESPAIPVFSAPCPALCQRETGSSRLLRVTCPSRFGGSRRAQPFRATWLWTFLRVTEHGRRDSLRSSRKLRPETQPCNQVNRFATTAAP